MQSEWPLPAVFPANMSSDQLRQLRTTPNSIGFVSTPSARALGLPEAQVQSPDGAVVEPKADFIESALALAHRGEGTQELHIEAESADYPFIGIAYFGFETGLPAGNCSGRPSPLSVCLRSKPSRTALSTN